MRVVMYKATDGTVFDNQADCNRYEGNLRIHAATQKAMDDKKFDISYLPQDDRGNTVMYAADPLDVSAFLQANREVILDILNSAIVVKRGRKPRASAEPQPGSYA